MSSVESQLECWRQFRFDREYLRPVLVPGRDSADQSSAADSDEQRVELWRLILQFQSERTLSEQCLDSFVGMDRKRTGTFDPLLARFERIGVPVAADHELSPIASNAIDLRGRSDRRNEDRRAPAQLHRRKGDCQDRKSVV